MRDNILLDTLMRTPAFLLVTALSLCGADGPPPTKTVPVTETLHGITITDPYRWLEDQNSPETRAWLNAQNAYTRAYLDKIPGRDKLEQRLTALGRVEAVGLPRLRGGRYFFTRRLASEDRASICMRTGFDGKDQVLVDPASVGDESHSINLMGISEDGKLIAYGVRRGGEDEVEVRLLDVDRRELLPFRLPRARYAGISMKNDRSGIFYSRYVTGQGARVYYHAMAGAGEDREIFGSQYGPEAITSAGVTEDGRYLVLTVAFGVPPRKTEIYVKDIVTDGPIRRIVSEDGEFRAFLETGDKLYVATNWKAPNQRILSIDLNHPAPDQWVDVVPESEWPIEGASAAGGRIFVEYLENVKTRVKQYTAAGKYLGDVKLPGVGSVSGIAGRWKDDEAFFTYASFVEPGTEYRYRVSTAKQDLWFRPNIPVAPDDFEVRQVWYESRDKTRVPMFLVYKKGLTLDGNRPVYLTGYGGFNISETPAFSRPRGDLGRDGRRVRPAQPARRRRIRREMAPGRDVREQAERVRRFHRRRRMAGGQSLHEACAHRHRGRVERGPAGRRGVHPAPRPVRRGGLRHAAAGHAALPEVQGRFLLGNRVRLGRRRQAVPLPLQVLALSECEEGRQVPGHPFRFG